MTYDCNDAQIQCVRANQIFGRLRRQSRGTWRSCWSQRRSTQPLVITPTPESVIDIAAAKIEFAGCRPMCQDQVQVSAEKVIAPESLVAKPDDEADRRAAQAEDSPESTTDENLMQLPQERLVQSLGLFLKHMAAQASKEDQPSGFQSVCIPKVSISGYITRMYKYLQCSDQCFVMGLVYIDRIVRSHEHIDLTDLTCHRLFFICVVVAAKFYDDDFASNEYFARVGGLDTVELNALEADLLKLLDWKLYVGASEYTMKLKALREMS